MASFINTDLAYIPGLGTSFDSLKGADADLTGTAISLNESMIFVDSSSKALTPAIGTGKASLKAAGVNRMGVSLATPTAKEAGLAAQDGTTGYFVYADAAVNVLGYDEVTSTWLQLGSPAAKTGYSISMNAPITHAVHGNVNISRLSIVDPNATASARSMVRMVPQKSSSGAGLTASAALSTFSKDVIIDKSIGVRGPLSVDGLASFKDVMSVASKANPSEIIFMSGDTADVRDVAGNPLASWTVDCNLFRGNNPIAIESKENAGTTILMAGDSSSIRDVSGNPLASWTVDCNLFRGAASLAIESNDNPSETIFMVGDSSNVRDVSGNPLASWTVDCNLFRPAPAVAGQAPAFVLHNEHGVVMGSPDGTAFSLSVDNAGNISASAIPDTTYVNIT